jgi:uncharacterized membrane protein YbhN (UPF0104 family)
MIPQNTKRIVKFLLQVIFSVLALWWIFSTLGAQNIADAFARATFPLILSGVLLYLVAQIFSAWRWAIISKILKFNGRVGYYNQMYFLGMFYNIFLPTGYGGDIVKVLYQASDRKPPSKVFAAMSIFLDRLSGLFALLLVGAVASVGLSAKFGIYGVSMAFAFFIGLSVGIVLLKPLSRYKALPRKLRFILLALRAEGRSFIPVAVLSVIIQALNIFIYAILLSSIGSSLSLSAIAFIYALATIATLLPISVGGLGVREGAWGALSVAFGATAQPAVVASLLYFGVQTICSGLGIFPLFMLKKSENLTNHQ